MKKVITILFLFGACAIMLAHNVVAHHHHETSPPLTSHQHTSHHHDDSNDQAEDHNVFSFAQLDESYIPSNDQINRINNFDFVCLAYRSLQLEITDSGTNQKFTKSIDDPPSDYSYSNALSLRGPPVF